MMRYAMLFMAVLLSACGSGKTDERDAAAGKILPGSASDAMLQTDGLQSEATLATPEVVDEDGEAGEKGAAPAKADKPDSPETPDAEPPAAAPPTPAAETPAP